MDIKEAIETVKLSEGMVYTSGAENKKETCCNRYIVPADSTCIADIDNVCQKVNKFIDSAFENLDKEEDKQEKIKIIGTCMESLKFLDMYKNIRLNVELSRKIKFNIDPTPPKD